MNSSLILSIALGVIAGLIGWSIIVWLLRPIRIGRHVKIFIQQYGRSTLKWSTIAGIVGIVGWFSAVKYLDYGKRARSIAAYNARKVACLQQKSKLLLDLTRPIETRPEPMGLNTRLWSNRRYQNCRSIGVISIAEERQALAQRTRNQVTFDKRIVQECVSNDTEAARASYCGRADALIRSQQLRTLSDKLLGINRLR